MTTPATVRHGWLGPDEAERVWQLIGDQFNFFFIANQTKATDGRRLVLWDYAKKVNGGKHLPTWRQEIGDCVSMGATNAVDYMACMEIAKLGQPEAFHGSFPPYFYGISRVQIGGGRLGNSDGSLGSWAALGVQKYGVLRKDYEGVPQYSGNVASSWGSSGPPKKFVEEGTKHLVKSAARLSNYPQIRDALLNGYPVTIASNRGFKMKPVVDRGKHWGVASGSWAHQMCYIGVDDDQARPGCYCLNSWGEQAHGPPADDAPPGGFWVDAEVVDSMAKSGEAFACSQFDGFPEQDLDWDLFNWDVFNKN